MEMHGALPALVGLGMGMKHALEPDHLAAVGTLMHGESSAGRLARLGALWGAGHLSTVATGVALLTAFRVAVPDQHLLFFEVPVAFMLLALGGWTLAGALRSSRPLQCLGPAAARLESLRTEVRPAWWSYVVGLIHGLAGTGALVIFVAATFPDAQTAFRYVLLFGVGAMLGMALITATLAFPLRALRRQPMLYRTLTALAGGFSILLALSILGALIKSYALVNATTLTG